MSGACGGTAVRATGGSAAVRRAAGPAPEGRAAGGAARGRHAFRRRRGQDRGLEAEGRGDREDRREARALGLDGGAVGLAGFAEAEVAAQRATAQGAAAGDREFLADRRAGGGAGVAFGHQLGSSLEDEGLDLAGRHVDRLGDLRLREAAQLEQHERRALVLGQAPEVADELAQVGAQLDAVGQSVEGWRDVVQRHRDRLARGQHRQAAVAGDRVQPWPDRVGDLAGTQRPVGAQEGLLERVLAVFGRPEHVAAEGQQGPVVAVVEDLEGGLVAAGDAGGQAGVVELFEAPGHVDRSTLPERGWEVLGISQAFVVTWARDTTDRDLHPHREVGHDRRKVARRRSHANRKKT